MNLHSPSEIRAMDERREFLYEQMDLAWQEYHRLHEGIL